MCTPCCLLSNVARWRESRVTSSDKATRGDKLKTVNIPKQVFYKQARFLRPTGLTLQVLLTRAIQKLAIAERHELVNSDGVTDKEIPNKTEWYRFINTPRTYAGCCFGVLVLASPNFHRLVIDTATAAGKEDLDVSKFPPPTGKQHMETPLYFTVRDNHVVLVQSQAVRSDKFEAHLNWLLAKAGQIDDEQRIELSDIVPEETQQKIAKSPVKRIALGGSFLNSAAVPNPDPGAVTKAMKVATGMGLDILKSILPSEQYSALKVEEMTDMPEVQVNLEIKVVGRKKAQTDNQVMRSIMNGLRHVPDADFINVQVEGYGSIKGQELRVHDKKNFPSIDGVLVTEGAFEVMRRWLEALVDKGTVRTDS